VTVGAYPGPLHRFLVQLDELRHGDAPVMHQVGQLLVELAADEEYFAPLIGGIPAGSPGVHWLVSPERGPDWCSSTGQKG
jgi:hypothetical protein